MANKEKLILSTLTVGALLVGSAFGLSALSVQTSSSPLMLQAEGSCKSGGCKSGACNSAPTCDPTKDPKCACDPVKDPNCKKEETKPKFVS